MTDPEDESARWWGIASVGLCAVCTFALAGFAGWWLWTH